MSRADRTLAERCRAIELLVLDVDGVLTAGDIVYAGTGLELKSFHVRDGSALKIWRDAGKRVALISGRASDAVGFRARELAITEVHQGVARKLETCRQLMATSGLAPEQVACMGDDLADVPLLEGCGLAVAVADACPEVVLAADYVTQAPGGRGAVREAIALVLRCQGRWPRD